MQERQRMELPFQIQQIPKQRIRDCRVFEGDSEMSKLDQYMQGRTEGMEFALRLAKDKGIEELEKEVRFRNRTGVSLNLTRQELAAGSQNIKNMTFDTMLAMSLMVLRDEFDFGKKRLERFKDRFAQKATSLADDYCT